MPVGKAKEFQSIIEPEWEKLPVRFPWSYYVSPPFPSAWPPEAGACVFYYVYGGNMMDIQDGLMIGSIFGRVVIESGEHAAPRFERLADEIREVGIQGVRPLERFEIEIYREGERSEEFLKSLNALPDESSEKAQAIRQFYRLWFEHSGIAGEIRLFHEEFFKWVEQTPQEKKPWWKVWGK